MIHIRTLYFWTVGGIYFGSFLCAAWFLSFLVPLRKLDPFLKAWLRGLFKLFMIRVDVDGLENLDPNQHVVYMVNHVSLLDIPLIGGFVPGFLRGIEASRQHRWPLYGRAMRRLGNIPIEREKVQASLGAIAAGLELLEQGVSLVIFPEGGRTSDGKLKNFKKLPFHLAKQAKVPLVPIAICGLFELNNKNAFAVRPGRIRLRIGKPVPVDRIDGLDVMALRQMVKDEIQVMGEGQPAG